MIFYTFCSCLKHIFFKGCCLGSHHALHLHQPAGSANLHLMQPEGELEREVPPARARELVQVMALKDQGDEAMQLRFLPRFSADFH